LISCFGSVVVRSKKSNNNSTILSCVPWTNHSRSKNNSKMAPRGRPPGLRNRAVGGGVPPGGGGPPGGGAPGGGGDGGPPGGGAPPPPAAAPNPLCGYLTDVLQIPLVVANAVLEEGGFRTFPDLITLDDTQMLDISNKNCRKLQAPNAANADDPASDDDDDNNEGGGGRIRVLDLACTRLRHLVFYCFHLDRINRPFNTVGASYPKGSTAPLGVEELTGGG
jgi:hypothetical protein